MEAQIRDVLKQVADVPVDDASASVDDIGRMTAEAVLQVYDTTAKQVEGMGTEIKALIAKLAQAMADADADLKLLGEAANAIRAKGDRLRTLLSEASETSKLIRDACQDFKDKVKDDR